MRQQQQSSQGNVGRWAELQGSALRRTHTAISATIINIASQPQPQQQIQQQNMSTKHTHRHRDTHTDTHRHNGTHLRQKTNVSNCVCISRPPPPPLLHSVLLQLLLPLSLSLLPCHASFAATRRVSAVTVTAGDGNSSRHSAP